MPSTVVLNTVPAGIVRELSVVFRVTSTIALEARADVGVYPKVFA